MLNENLAKIRKEKSLTQEALAVKLNVVRQTISAWERGTAVPDANMLCAIAEALEVPVSTLLGNPDIQDSNDMAKIAMSLSQINEQLAIRNRRSANLWKIICIILLLVCGFTIGKIYGNHNESNNIIQTVVPENITLSGVEFGRVGDQIKVTFVPSVSNEQFDYIVTMYDQYEDDKGVSVHAKCENGICIASFDLEDLETYCTYKCILNISCNGSDSNILVAKNVTYSQDGCSWEME